MNALRNRHGLTPPARWAGNRPQSRRSVVNEVIGVSLGWPTSPFHQGTFQTYPHYPLRPSRAFMGVCGHVSAQVPTRRSHAAETPNDIIRPNVLPLLRLAKPPGTDVACFRVAKGQSPGNPQGGLATRKQARRPTRCDPPRHRTAALPLLGFVSRVSPRGQYVSCLGFVSRVSTHQATLEGLPLPIAT